VENQKIKVLVVDKDKRSYFWVKALLSKIETPGYHLDWASIKDSNMKEVEKKECDVFLLDDFDGGQKGIELVQQFSRKGCLAPIILITGKMNREVGIQAIKAGVADYIEKGKMDFGHLDRSIRFAIERKKTEIALEEQAIRDPLTGLYNRRLFDTRIREEIARANRKQTWSAILLCDIDGFKAINDSRGHQAGDEVLRDVGRSIKKSTRGTDLVFRWGDDEIMVVLSDTAREGALLAAERIREGVREVRERTFPGFDISIGIAFYPDHGTDAEQLIRVSDIALYIAKKGGDKIHIGTEEYHLDKHSSKVLFQPVVAIQPIWNVRANQLLGYEALTRDPEGKLSPYALFKKYDAIGKLNELKCICFETQLKKAKENQFERLFINVDFNVLSQFEIIPKPPGTDVVLEISELEALHDVENRLEIAKKWKAEGYKFAIDDFGAGFISLPFIARLFPDYIKFDRSTMLQAVYSEQFKEFMIGLVFALNNYATEGIIAEGVETELELKVVRETGIFIIQGFLFGRPEELK